MGRRYTRLISLCRLRLDYPNGDLVRPAIAKWKKEKKRKEKKRNGTISKKQSTTLTKVS